MICFLSAWLSYEIIPTRALHTIVFCYRISITPLPVSLFSIARRVS